jgi:acyl-CoA reductase-like NAD-dependent aldehyde dehydrogenase
MPSSSTAASAAELKGETVALRPGGAVATRCASPIGVVGAILPWNVPMMLMAMKIAPAHGGGQRGRREVGRGGAAGGAAHLRDA